MAVLSVPVELSDVRWGTLSMRWTCDEPEHHEHERERNNAPPLPDGQRTHRRGVYPGWDDHPLCACGRERYHSTGAGGVRRPRHRRGGECADREKRPHQAGSHGGRVPFETRRQSRQAAAEVRRPGGRAGRPQVHRLRWVPQGARLSQGRRRRYLRHPARLPLGAFQLRHRQRAQCVYGEAGDGGRPNHSTHAQTRGVKCREEPQGRGRTDDPPLPGAPGIAQPDPSRPNRRYRGHARVSHGVRRWHRPAHAGGDHRTAPPDSPVPRIPVGLRRCLQRFLYPPDR